MIFLPEKILSNIIRRFQLRLFLSRRFNLQTYILGLHKKFHAVNLGLRYSFNSLLKIPAGIISIIWKSWLTIISFWVDASLFLSGFTLRNWYKLIVFALILLILFLLPGQNDYERLRLTSAQTVVNKLPIVLPSPAPYPKNRSIRPVPSLTAAGVMIIDTESNVSLYEKNPDLALSPASTTKIMTALVTLDHFDLNDVITVNDVTTESRTMGLVSGEQIRVESLLYGVLVHSANDGAQAIARSYPGGVDAFVAAMNTKAKELHLQSAHFTNPIGFDDPNQYISARDLTRLSIYALEKPIIAKIASTRAITVSDITYSRFHELTNVNQLLGKIPGVAGLKTGYTPASGECLVTFLIKPNAKIVFILLKSQDRFGETESLISWVADNFTWVAPGMSPDQTIHF